MVAITQPPHYAAAAPRLASVCFANGQQLYQDTASTSGATAGLLNTEPFTCPLSDFCLGLQTIHLLGLSHFHSLYYNFAVCTTMHSWPRCPEGDIRPEAILSRSFGSSHTASHRSVTLCKGPESSDLNFWLDSTPF